MKRPSFARIAQLSNTAAIVEAVESQQARRSGSQREYVAPQGKFEEAIADIWAKLLRIERAGRADDFFQLGGHSLLATQMISRVWESCGVQVPLVAIFANTTLESFARVVETAALEGDTAGLAPLKRVARPERLPLSYGQQRFWFLDQLEPGSLFYNVVSKWRLRGTLNVAALEAAISEVVARHEVLRTTYVMQGGAPIQVIAPAQRIALPITDFSGFPEAERDERALELVNEESRRPFDLERGPMFRPQLLRLGEDDHVLVLSTHHIAMDGWSFGILRQEIYTLYTAFAAGEPSPLAPLPLQYADYAVWQRTHVEGEALDRQVEFWKEHLRDAPPSIELPTDRPRPALQTYRGANAVAVLPRDLVEALASLSQEEGSTLFMTLLAGFYVLLARYSGQDDIVVGSAIAGRTHSDTEKLLGLFVNTLALRAHVSGDLSFRELLRRVREITVNAYAHQDVPFERLVEELNPVRDSSRSPLYQVMLVLQNVPPAKDGMPGLEVGAFGSTNEHSQMDLLLTLVDQPEGLAATLTYNTDLFDQPTIARMLAHYQRLLEGIVQDPSVSVAKISLLSFDELQELASFNATHADFGDVCLHQLVSEQVQRTPQATAIVDGDERLSFAELDRRANRVAHELIERGVVPDTLVGIYFERSAEMLVAILGVLKAGGAYVPLDPNYPTERIAHILEDGRAKIIVSREPIASTLPTGTPWMSLDDAHGQPETAPATAVQPHNLAYVLFTSGSTGRPKGVAIEHHSVATFIQWALMAFTPEQLSGVLLSTSVCFDLSIFEIFAPLACGGKIILGENALHLPTLTARAEVTLVNTVPSAIAELVRSGGVPENVRTVNLAGEALSADLVEKIYSQTCVEQVFNLYGPTEDTTYSTYTLVPRGAVVTIGRPLANTQALILDRELQLQPIGVPGELYLAGDGLARGYLHRPDLTAERFLPNPFKPGSRMYKTGDLCRWLPDGNIEYLGRLDHQVKVRGFRIELGEIEAALAAETDIRDAVVIAREDVPGDKRLVAYVVSNSELDSAKLRMRLKKTLPEFMIPAAFVALERLPLTPNGKLDRKALPAPDTYGVAGGEGIAPRTGMEKLVAEIWKDILKIPSVNIEDDFFQIGGHSLLATQMISRVREFSGVKVPLVEIFKNPTLESFARAVEIAVSGGEIKTQGRLTRVPRTERLPLSYGQHRLWFLDQLEPGSVFYNVVLTRRLSGILNVAALELALSELVARHEVLRTTYVTDDEGPVQVIAPARPVALPLTDLRAVAEAERETRARAFVGEEVRRPFDLKRGPIFRAMLLKLSEEEHVLVMSTHHIAVDGWSIAVLLRDLTAFYSKAVGLEAAMLAPLPVQYADYAAWQRTQMKGEALTAQLEYWKGKLRNAPPSIDLPTDRPRPVLQTFCGATRETQLPLDLLEALKALGQREGSTLYMTLLAAFCVLLSRYSGQEDIVVGSAIAGRTHSDTENLIGLFLNTLAMRVDVSGSSSFRELLRRVRETTVNAYAHQDVPFERLVEELNPARDASRSPLYQVMLVLQNTPSHQIELPGLQISGFGSSVETSQMDLLLDLTELPEGLRARLTYNTDLFDESTIDRMLAHFEVVLRGMVADPNAVDTRVDRIELLGAAERSLMLYGWNQTAVDFGAFQPSYAAFLARAEREPERIALECDGAAWTYRKFASFATGLAQRLIAEGLKPGDLAGICVPRSPQMVGAVLAVMMAGGAYVPLDPRHPRERLQMVLDDAGASILLTMGELGLETSAKVLNVSESFPPSDVGWQPVPVDAGSLAYVIYTSGSTGKPKGVAIEHGALMNLLRSMEREPGLTADDTLVSVTTLSFDIAGLELLLPLLTGAKLVVATDDEVTDGRKLLALLERTKATTLQATPGLWRVLIDAGWSSALPLKALCGGEALPRDLADKLVDRAGEVWNVYGPTETTIWSSATRVTRGTGPLRVGPPIANTQFYVLDQRLLPVPIGVSGELYIGGDGLARGYWKRPELTAEKFVPNPFGPHRIYAAGDVARWHDDGTIELIGRADFQVKIRGFRIELGEIEAALRAYPGVSNCVVIAREDVPGDKYLAAYIVPSPDSAPDINDIRAHIGKSLPEYMVPAAIVPLDTLPTTPNGKIDRKALPAPASHDRQTAIQGAAPRTPLQELIAGIFSEVLKADSVGANANFFELGGHSLSAMQVIARVQRALDIDVPLRILFEMPTVAGLATRVEALRNGDTVSAAAPPIARVARDRPLALSFAQQRLWFLAQMDQDSALYNVPLAQRMKGDLNATALQQALGDVVARHEVLRTRYAVENDEPVQVIDEAAPVALPVIDLRALPEDEREAEATRILQAESQRPFHLASDAMLRALLLQLGPSEHILLLNTHHIATDGWSIGVLWRDLTAFYRKALGLDAPELPPLQIQYADYAAWQRNWLQGSVLEEQLEFWKKTLEGVPPTLQLPTDRARPVVQTYTGAMHSFDVPPEIMAVLKKLGRGEGATCFMLLLAAFQVLIYYFVKQPDIVLGTDLANRTTVQTEELIGFFVNLLVLRADLSGDISFRELLGRVRPRTLNAYAHQDVPFDKLVEELQPERSHSHNPLVQVLFVQQNTPQSITVMERLELSGVSIAVPSKFDMAIFVRDSEQGLAGAWQYNADLFNASTIEKMASLYLIILKEVTAFPDTKISALTDLLAEWELQHSASIYLESKELSRQRLKRKRRAVLSS